MVHDGGEPTQRGVGSGLGTGTGFAEGDGDTQIDGNAPTLTTPGRPAFESAPPAPTTGGGSKPAARGSGAALELVGLGGDARYRVGELLVQGGMGELRLAFDDHIGREVVIKQIRAPHPTGEDIARFVREARIQGRLEHPAVVPVHDLAVDELGRPYFVMKRLAGTEMRELLERLRAGGEPDPVGCRRRLLRAFVDVCLAIELAHTRGIVHRDLKPANIMLGDYGEVYVLDWGVARMLSEADADPAIDAMGATAAMAATIPEDLSLPTGETRAGAILGTPAYMAPEQLVGERVGPAADVYSLGCILFEIVAGFALHPERRSLAAAFTVSDARPSSRRPEAPPELDGVVLRATALDPAARFGSARALGGAVQAYLDGDRDIAARKELAAHHLDEARTALARGDGDGDRQTAMRAAGRALALDPTAAEAAALVGHLMLQPPRDLPAEVRDRLEGNDVAIARAQGRIGALAITGYLWFVPILWWTGVRDYTSVIAFSAVAVVSALHIYLMTRAPRVRRIPRGGIYLSAAINAVLIGLVCRLVGPFIIAPTLVLTTLMAYAVHPMLGRVRVIAAILVLGVAVPWALELAGVLAPTYEFSAGAILLSSPAITFSALPVQIAFGVLLVLLASVVGVLLRSIAVRQREVAQRVEVQAWQLRQIVHDRR